MNQLHRQDVIHLAQQRANPAVSIYLPLASTPDQQDKNRIRLKNLVTQGLNRLVDDHGLRQAEAEAFMAPARRLMGDNRFWSDSHDEPGLAMFLTAAEQMVYRLPIAFAQRVVVGDRFFLKPLLPLLACNGRFRILALSLGAVRLFEATQYGIGEIALGEEVPRSIGEALQWDDPEARLQWHTATSSGDDRPAAYHGHGSAEDATGHENVLRYFQKVDAALQPLLREDDLPLILAALEQFIPPYLQATSYRHVLDQVIQIDPQSLSMQELHRRAWQEVIQPYFTAEREQAAAGIDDLHDTRRAAFDVATIVRAACQGQIDTLFVAQGEAAWGSYDAATHRVDVHHQPATGRYDLVELAAVQTLLHGGTLFAADQAEVPQQQIMAARFRYPVPVHS